ncbi:MAG: chemotaxis protein, partial [Opitutaceae bacterium]|nr:chemotaxis protein [Opitutaceae bacterium]
ADLTAKTREFTKWTITCVVVIMVLAFGLGGWIAASTQRAIMAIVDRLAESARQTRASADQLSATGQEMASGAAEQAASLEETSASLEEMAGMTRHNAENAGKVNELGRQTRAAAEKGSNDMAEMIRAMDTIKASSDEVSKIIKTIDEISFQTNILALNAAVEAARAGEAGLGFAVVSEEVRNLAQRSARAAQDTSAKIQSAIARTVEGVNISRAAAAGLAEIVAKARQVDELAAQVATASREQSTGIDQVNKAVGQIDTVTQSNAAAAEESAAAATDLGRQAALLEEAVDQLSILVGAGQRISVPPVSSPVPAPAVRPVPLEFPARPARRHDALAAARH